MEVEIKRVPETLSPEIIEKMGATGSQKVLSVIPEVTVNDLTTIANRMKK